MAAVAEERASLQAEKKKLAAKEQDVDEKIKEMDAFMGRVKDDPFEFMKEVAGDNWYFDATQRFLNKGQPTKEQKEQRLEQRIAALEEQNRKLSEQRDQEKVQVEAEKRSAAYMGNLQAELSKPEYAIVSNDPSAVNELIQLVTGYARDNQGELLPAEDALGRIKTAQLERLKKLQATEAWAAEFGAAQESPQKPKPRPAPIVTNDPPHRASPPTEGEDDDLTPVERRERAAQAVLASLQGS